MVEPPLSGRRPAGPRHRGELRLADTPGTAAPPVTAVTAAQLERDRLVVEALRADGFTGERFNRRYTRLVGPLASQTWSTMYAWTGEDGRAFAESARLGRPVERVWLEPLNHYDREDLASETVMSAHRLFLRMGLRGGHWTPEKGATLQTYFTGAAKLGFKNAYRRWERQKLRNGDLLVEAREDEDQEDVLSRIPSREPGPERMADLKDQVARVWRLMKDDERLQAVMLGRGDGLTERAAAELAGVSVKVAETRSSRFRVQHVRRSPAGDGEYGKEVF